MNEMSSEMFDDCLKIDELMNCLVRSGLGFQPNADHYEDLSYIRRAVIDQKALTPLWFEDWLQPSAEVDNHRNGRRLHKEQCSQKIDTQVSSF